MGRNFKINCHFLLIFYSKQKTPSLCLLYAIFVLYMAFCLGNISIGNNYLMFSKKAWRSKLFTHHGNIWSVQAHVSILNIVVLHKKLDFFLCPLSLAERGIAMMRVLLLLGFLRVSVKREMATTQLALCCWIVAMFVCLSLGHAWWQCRFVHTNSKV